ncbi:MAG: class I SAM-dependent methyltransferase [Desulfobaccales bacterium]
MQHEDLESRVMNLQSDNIIDIHDILDKLDALKDGIVFVDLGCGNGQATVKYLGNKKSARIFAIDIANKLCDKNQNQISLIQADLDFAIPLKDNSVDVIVCNQTIEHLKNLEKYFLELRRVLHPDGIAVISSVNLSSFHSIIMLCLTIYPTILTPFRVYLGNMLYGQPGIGHNWGFNRAILKDIAKFFDFELIKIWGEGYYFVPRIVSRLLSKLFPYWAVYIGFVIKKRIPNRSYHEPT